jgi:hypothetical protein
VNLQLFQPVFGKADNGSFIAVGSNESKVHIFERNNPMLPYILKL